MSRPQIIPLNLPKSWPLFCVLALVVSIGIILGLPQANLQSARDTELLILRSVRCALPFFLIAFTASSLVALWPNRVTRWLLSNRRYFGLAFALGMAWHLTFVAYFLLTFGNHLNRLALTLDLVGLGFLVALTLTSFRPLSRQLSAVTWRRLHTTGVYWIWILLTYIYLGGARSNRDLFYFSILGILVAAWALRAAAWMRRRLDRRSSLSPWRGRSAY